VSKTLQQNMFNWQFNKSNHKTSYTLRVKGIFYSLKSMKPVEERDSDLAIVYTNSWSKNLPTRSSLVRLPFWTLGFWKPERSPIFGECFKYSFSSI